MADPIPIWLSYYVGIKFAEHGRDAKEGVDCWGLIRLIYDEEFDILLPSYRGNYKRTTDAKSIQLLVQEESESWISVPKGKERFGDVIVMNVRGRPMHVGMVIEKNSMIHSQQGSDSCIEKYNSPNWNERVFAFYRHAKLK